MADTNAMGARGESIFKIRITEHYLFTGDFLGDKFPIVDFLLEVNEPTGTYPFFVQVKSTEKGYDANGNLQIKVPKNKYRALQRKPFPTYVAGVDVNKEIVYLCSAFQKNKTISSMPTRHCLKFSRKKRTLCTLQLLKQDVIDYWDGLYTKVNKDTFRSKL